MWLAASADIGLSHSRVHFSLGKHDFDANIQSWRPGTETAAAAAAAALADKTVGHSEQLPDEWQIDGGRMADLWRIDGGRTTEN